MTQAFASKDTLHRAIELVNTGRDEQSEALCRRAIESNPKDVNMVALLGALLLKTGRLDEAEQQLCLAIELAPGFAKPREDLGRLLLEQKRADEAIDVLSKATELDPQLDDAHFNLGKALALAGKGKDADIAFEKSIDLKRKALAHAAEHQRAGRFDEAEKLYRQILRNNPVNVDALRLLGTVAFQAQRMEEAEQLFRRATVAAPDFVAAIIDLGRVLKEQGRFEDAIRSFRRVLALEPDNIQASFLLAGTLSPAALNYEAIQAFERALKLRPNHPGALLGLGHALKAVGRQEEAVTAYRACAREWPKSGASYWSLANLKSYQLSDADIEEIKSRLDQGELNVESEVNFLFALAKATEDKKDFKEAWQYYHDGNKLRRENEYYNPVRTEVAYDSVIETFDARHMKKNAGLGNPDPAAIFVVGLPRSGLTLIEQVLASHSQVESTSELPYIGHVAQSLNRNRADGIVYPKAVLSLEPGHLQRLGQDYLRAAQLHRTESKPRFIDKMPNNFPHLGFLHLILPNAKIIDARRQPLDSCLNCYRQLFASGRSFTYDLTDIGEYFLQYQRLMDHWHTVMPGQVLTLQYEEVVTDFENQIERLLAFCELPSEEGCFQFHQTERPVRTASSEQDRQPVYNSSINFWRNYEQELGELIEVLDPVLDRYQQYSILAAET
jgi:tetratricopeptide (TPR) repeat protein